MTALQASGFHAEEGSMAVIWGEVRMDISIYIPLRYRAINHLFHEALHT